MGLKKGNTNNPNGRPKGMPNKITRELREWISKFIDENRAQVQKDWMKLEPKDRIQAFQSLLKYVLPTLQSVQVTDDIDSLSDDQVEQLYNKLKNQV